MRASTSFFYVLLSRRVAVLTLLLFVASVTFAQITPSDDAYINSAAPTANYGAAPTLNLQTAVDTAFIRFDLTAVPAGYTGSSIAKATLKLYVNTVTTAGSFNVDYVTGTWSEQTIKYNLQPALGTTIAASVPLTTASKGKYIEIDITSAMIDWLNNAQPNDGIALVANSPLVATLDSKENTAASHPPEIDIVFAAISGVTTASGSGLTGGGASGTLNLALTNTCATNQVLQWSGSSWTCAAVGTGTITGVTAGADLTGGGTGGNVTLNLDLTQVPQLNYPNVFTGNQTVNGNLSATGLVTGTAFNIGSNLFAFGSYANANAFLGFAGNATTTGTGNTASGFYALSNNTSGNNNTAAGIDALLANTTGNQNAASGGGALYFNTGGFNNAASGYWALYKNSTGSGNTASGAQALFSNTTGSYNTSLGYNAGPDQNSPNLTNATAIGANAVVSESNALVLGGTGANAVNVGIGTATPQYSLDVNGTGNFTGLVKFASSQKFPGTITGVKTAAGSGLTGGGTSGTLNLTLTSACAANQALQWNGTAWVCATLGTGTVTSVGFTAPSTDFLVTGSPVTVGGTLGLGWLVAPDYNNTPNAIVKRDSFGNFSAGTINAATGYYLGSSPFAIGSWSNSNVFFGFAGNLTTTGVVNTATGADALLYITSGGSNTATGGDALNYTTTGNSNTAAGYAALQNNTTGNNNTATGVATLLSSNGSGNTANGFYAGSGNLTGSYNTALGYFAEVTSAAPALTNSTAIGAYSEVTQSNSLVLGSILNVGLCTTQNSCASTNVGIGTTAPQYMLDVNGTGNFTGLVKFSPSQTFPGAGTITGVAPGTDLTGGGSSGNVTLSVDTTKVVTAVLAGTDLTGGGTGGVQTLNLDTTKVPQLGSANTFTGAQTFNNSVIITSSASQALTVSGATSDGIYSSGSYAGLFGQGAGSTGTGVIGQGYTGGHFVGTSGDGVSGGSTSGNGVYGGGVTGVYGSGTTIGVNGIGSSYGVLAQGNLGATGTKSAVVALPDDRVVSLYAMESPENWFEDFGSGKLQDGISTIPLDPTFAQTVSPEVGYHVFLTPNGDCEGLYVAQKTATGFVVRELHAGKSSVAFDYRIVAKRKGLESLRLEDVQADHETAEAIRQQIASRPSNPPRLKLPKLQPQAAVPEPLR